MIKLHPFTKEAALTLLYIGAVSALVSTTLTLAVLFSLGTEFTQLHWGSTLVSAAGWLALPFAPRFYRAKTGHGFLMSDAFEAGQV